MGRVGEGEHLIGYGVRTSIDEARLCFDDRCGDFAQWQPSELHIGFGPKADYRPQSQLKASPSSWSAYGKVLNNLRSTNRGPAVRFSTNHHFQSPHHFMGNVDNPFVFHVLH